VAVDQRAVIQADSEGLNGPGAGNQWSFLNGFKRFEPLTIARGFFFARVKRPMKSQSKSRCVRTRCKLKL
jgi:hypothetical protein